MPFIPSLLLFCSHAWQIAHAAGVRPPSAPTRAPGLCVAQQRDRGLFQPQRLKGLDTHSRAARSWNHRRLWESGWDRRRGFRGFRLVVLVLLDVQRNLKTCAACDIKENTFSLRLGMGDGKSNTQHHHTSSYCIRAKGQSNSRNST